MFGITSSRSGQIKAAMQQILARRNANSAGKSKATYAPTSIKMEFYNRVNEGNYKEALRLGEKILGTFFLPFIFIILISIFRAAFFAFSYF